VEAYSGSTIDSLGLAIRVALVRTFLPTAPFLILDEPAAACSEARTDNMLGFVVGCGFPQVLLVTHEDVSESVADHIITLGDTV
jgi:ABC-type transport system involved in cytochrome bd biosynthesis fused ATPase/permease subunit